jgi:hypothetical protein
MEDVLKEPGETLKGKLTKKETDQNVKWKVDLANFPCGDKGRGTYSYRCNF